MTIQDVLKRAHAARKMNIRYKLGAGGTDPRAATPGNPCDCSGFTAWALGFARVTKDPFYLTKAGGWINTDSMVADARDPRGVFDQVPVGQARPGDLIVFGKGPGRRYGHVGVISRTLNGKPTHVIHCSAANTPSAVEETGADVFFKHSAIVIRHKDLVDAGQAPAPAPLAEPAGKAFTDIYTTEFGGGAERGMPSAYGGTVNPDALEASLPARVIESRRWIIVESVQNGRRARCRINDVGPHNTRDAYWETGSRPLAEEQFHHGKKAQNGKVPTNRAGLDVTPAVMVALGVVGKVNTRAFIARWWFE